LSILRHSQQTKRSERKNELGLADRQEGVSPIPSDVFEVKASEFGGYA
jgi:hypothetical protein